MARVIAVLTARNYNLKYGSLFGSVASYKFTYILLYWHIFAFTLKWGEGSTSVLDSFRAPSQHPAKDTGVQQVCNTKKKTDLRRESGNERQIRGTSNGMPGLRGEGRTGGATAWFAPCLCTIDHPFHGCLNELFQHGSVYTFENERSQKKCSYIWKRTLPKRMPYIAIPAIGNHLKTNTAKTNAAPQADAFASEDERSKNKTNRRNQKSKTSTNFPKGIPIHLTTNAP